MSTIKELIDVSKLTFPVVGVVSGSGQIAKSAAESGADILIVLNAGFYRNSGFGSLAAFMPYGNANDQTEKILRTHVLPHAKSIPVMAGVYGNDPELPITIRLERLQKLGIEAVTNWPAIGFIDGTFREALENEGLGIEMEVNMLNKAKSMGFITFGFALTEDDAYHFAMNGVDGLILNVGLTHDYEESNHRKEHLDKYILKAKQMLAAVSRSGKQPLTLVFGGCITKAEDFEEVIKQVPLHGYAGGSVFERIAVSETVNLKVRQFKSIPLQNASTIAPPPFGPLIGISSPMKKLFKIISMTAPYDVNICIDGESGTGKELVANQIHLLSPRRNHSFVTINCGAIPETLVESEFFGYEKGAFTGAYYRKPGKFELADKGTLFLDEISDLSPHAQAALLRVIQQGEITTIGGQKPLPINVRIVAASNQNLENLVEQNKFRADLYFRLSTIMIKTPPLRERNNDIPFLVASILEKLAIKFHKKIIGVTEDFMKRLKNHSWPGNVRELEQVLTRFSLLGDSPVLDGKSFIPSRQTVSFLNSVPNNESNFIRAREALAQAEGNKTKASQILQISRKTLYAWLQNKTG